MDITHVVIELRHLIDPRRMALRNEQCEKVKEGTSAVLLQSVLDERWWADSLECSCHLRNVQDLMTDGKNTYERRFSSEIFSEFCTRPVQTPPNWQESCTSNIPQICVNRGNIWKGDILVTDSEELEKRTYLSLRNKRHKSEKCSYSELRIPKTHSQVVTNCRE